MYVYINCATISNFDKFPLHHNSSHFHQKLIDTHINVRPSQEKSKILVRERASAILRIKYGVIKIRNTSSCCNENRSSGFRHNVRLKARMLYNKRLIFYLLSVYLNVTIATKNWDHFVACTRRHKNYSYTKGRHGPSFYMTATTVGVVWFERQTIIGCLFLPSFQASG